MIRPFWRFALFDQQPVMLIATRKGRDLKTNMETNLAVRIRRVSQGDAADEIGGQSKVPYNNSLLTRLALTPALPRKNVILARPSPAICGICSACRYR